MPTKWMKHAWIAPALMLLVVGCGCTAAKVPPVPTTAAEFPTGKFVNGSYIWEFKGDGSFISTGPPGSETGTYTVRGNQVVITCQCCGEITGTYTWTYAGNVLIFKAIEDKCSNRLDVVGTGQWVKTP